MSKVLRTYLRNERAIKSFASKFGLSADEADEVAQESFLRGFAAEQIEDIHKPRAFLFRITRNLALEILRKKKRACTDNIEDFGGADIIVDDRQARADDQLDARMKMAAMARAVASLPPKCRQVFLLAKVERLRQKEIAAQLNMSVSNVEKLIAKGILKCSRYMRDQGYQPSELGISTKRSRPSLVRKNVDAGGDHG